MILGQKCLLNIDQSVLVGVSGGADSLCLLDVLHRLGYPLVVAHLNHLLRPEASHEVGAVEGVAKTLGIPFTLGEANTAAFAEEHKLSIEEAARTVRYQFLFEQAEIYAAQAVVVAHNADDQVETVLMHLLRGSGLDGLTGMAYRALPNPWSDHIPLVRPLLGIWRYEIEAYCTERGLKPVLDRSNLDTQFFRNRLRHELIPDLETYIPGARKRLWRMADLLSADRELLEAQTLLSWGDSLDGYGEGYIVLDPHELLRHPVGLQRRLVRRALAELRPGVRDVDYALVQRVLDFVTAPTSTGQRDVGLGLRAVFEDGRLVLATWEVDLPTLGWPQVTGGVVLVAPGEVDLGFGWSLRAEIPQDVESARREALGNSDPYQAWIDLGGRQPLLKVRPRLPGERFQPLGMGGHSVKLSDFMIDRKIPQRTRDGWPLICAGDEIVWVLGYRLAHPFRLTEGTKQAIWLRVERD